MTTPLTPQPLLPLLQAPGTNTRISVRLAGQGVGLEWQPEWSGPHREGLGFCEGAGSGHEGKAQEMDLCPGVSPPSPSPSPHPEGAAAGAVHAAQLQVQTSVPQRHERQCSWQPPRIAALAGSRRMPISSRMVKCVGGTSPQQEALPQWERTVSNGVPTGWRNRTRKVPSGEARPRSRYRVVPLI